MTNAHGTIEEANLAAARLLDMRPGAPVGKLLVSFVPLTERHFFRSNLNRLNSGTEGPVLRWRSALRGRSGAQQPVEIRVRALGSRAGYCWVLLTL